MSEPGEEDRVVVPVAEETVHVAREREVTARVRLQKRVHVEEQEIDLPVTTEDFKVERVKLDRWVEAPVPVRKDGDTIIYPVHEEVAVVTKRLRLVEEIRVTRQSSTRHERARVALRREEVVVEREEPGAKPGSATGE